MSLCDGLLLEFKEELKTTRRVLDRVPADKFTWKPHDKSMSLGQLAMHVATLPGGIAAITSGESFDVLKGKSPVPAPSSIGDVLAALDQSAIAVEETLKTTTEEMAYAQWRMVRGDKVLLAIPRAVAWRSMMLNHWYHHRGQLSVYLRLLGVPVPAMYGPSADENPFA